MAEYNPELVSVVKDILSSILDPDGTIEYYVDYQDSGCLDSAEDIKSLIDYLDEADGDIEKAAIYACEDRGLLTDISMDLERYVTEQVEQGIESYDADHDTELIDEFTDIVEFGEVYDFLEYCGFNGVNIPAIEFFPSEVCLEIQLATYEEANHEGYIIDFFGGYYPHESHIDDPEMRDNMLVEFMQSQGLQPEDVYDESKSGKVLDSVREELNNMTSNIDFLTVTGSFDILDAAKLLGGKFNSITINPGTTMGIFDACNGGGSILEIEVENPWTVPADKVERVKLSDDSGWGYSIADVYGINPNDSAFYRNTITVN